MADERQDLDDKPSDSSDPAEPELAELEYPEIIEDIQYAGDCSKRKAERLRERFAGTLQKLKKKFKR